MNLLNKLNILYQKNKKCIPFNKQDIMYAYEIVYCDCHLYKTNLIFILGEYIEDWSYKILKQLSRDEDESLRIHAIRKISGFLKTEDFWTLYEEFSDDSQFVSAAAIAALDFIGIEKRIDEKIRIQRLLDIKKKVPDSLIYVHILMDAKLFLDTEDETYLETIFSYMYHEDYEVRYQVMDSLDEIVANMPEQNETIQKIKNVLADKIKNGDSYRDNRIQASQIYYKICTRNEAWSQERYFIHQRECDFYSKLCKRVKNNPKLEDVLAWCVFQIYYPVEQDYSGCLEILDKYFDRFEDERFYIFGAYIEYAYGMEKENKYLKRLIDKFSSHKNQGVILILSGLWEMKYTKEWFRNKTAENCFEDALTYLEDVPMVYDQLSSLISAEDDRHSWAEEQSKRFKKKVSLVVMDRLPLEKLYSYETFLNMTILRKIEQPEYFLPS